MERITNDRDYRIGYEILCWLQEREQETTDYEKAGILHQRIIDKKRALRAYAQRDGLVDVGMGFMVERRIVHDGGFDGFVELVSIPEVYDTLEDKDGEPGAETFFKDFIYREARPSMYDCTGQAFTCWYKLFRRRGQFWAYHCVGFDV